MQRELLATCGLVHPAWVKGHQSALMGFAAMILYLTGGYAFAQQATVDANSLTFDEASQTAIASGDVKIVYSGNELAADDIEWDQAADKISARGNVRLTLRNGAQSFGDAMELSNGFQDGTISALHSDFSNGAHMQASQGTMRDGAIFTLNDVAYTACESCSQTSGASLIDKSNQIGKENGGSTPTWQLNSQKAIQDDQTQMVSYWNTWLEIKGVPVIYLPYFAHPTAEVDKKSGFLTPSLGQDGNLGTSVTTPYFWNLAPNYDITFRPQLTSDEGAILAADWRHMTDHGSYTLNVFANEPQGKLASIDGDHDVRGGIMGQGQFTKGDWSASFKIEEATDDFAFDRYNVSSATVFSNEAAIMRRYQNGSIRADLITYRFVNDIENSETVNKALPVIQHNHDFSETFLGGKLNWNNQFLQTVRNQGMDLTEYQSRIEWNWTHTSESGIIWSAKNYSQIDAYRYYKEDTDPNQDRDKDHTLAASSLAASIAYPLARYSDTKTEQLTPKLQIVLATENDKYDDVYLRNNVSNDLSTTRLFQMGDAADEVSRLNYGMNYQVNYSYGLKAEAFAGQSYNLSSRDLGVTTGYGEDSSNVVASGKLQYKQANLQTDLRLDQKTGDLLRNRTSMSISSTNARASVSYSFYENGQVTDEQLEEIAYRLQYDFNENWSLAGKRRENLEQSRPIEDSFAIRYEDDCSEFELRYQRDYTELGNLEPTSSLMLYFNLRTLGGLGKSSF
jgi:LPS-assembly protein